MENLRVLLCCGAGMSSGFLAQKTQQAANAKGVAMRVKAVSQSVVDDYLDEMDILLLGPHFGSHLGEFEDLAAPYHGHVAVIPQAIYGSLDGAGMVDFVLSELGR